VIVANRTWALLASTRVNGVVTDAQRGALIDELVRAAHSLNYDREHGGEKGEPWRRLFMSDTATAFAILALADSEQRIPSSTDR